MGVILIKQKCKIILILFLLLVNFSPLAVKASEVEQIQRIISKEVKQGAIPGVSIVVIKNGEILFMDSYNNPSYKGNINNDTKFEIGSNSKAFTGLGIMKLVRQGKLSLDDNIKKYIPWLHFEYNNKTVNILIKDFLNHKSGIPSNSIASIPITSDTNGLEYTVKKLNGMNLNRLPGSQFEYATINYDVLGLIIERISGETYANYMEKEIFKPLGLSHTSINIKKTEENTQGYKRGFFTNFKYNAPVYAGNVPAGYISSNIIDMSKWLQIQLNNNIELSNINNLILESHDINNSIDGTLNYSSGWIINKINNELFHGGNNPNYSSFILLNKENNFGVAVLTNTNSVYSIRIAYGIQNLLYSTKTELPSFDLNTSVDTFSTWIIIIALVLSCFIFLKLKIVHKKGNKMIKRRIKKKLAYVLLVLCMIFLFIEIGLIIVAPNLFLGYNWSFLLVWMPFSFLPAVVCFGILLVMLNLFGFYFIFFKKDSSSKKSNEF
ncbi:serine hydrolase domain-containing protein [Bacillus cereus]|uniref:serine hydrolase domain-containing protein n=1 Tax=Bacillus cereus TaxID=1396 RepID=UPI001CC25B49|nr:serine hydrolase domain-containing protein [Bacillus cereus]